MTSRLRLLFPAVLFCLVSCCLVFSSEALALEPSRDIATPSLADAHRGDASFPGANRVATSVATGVPFLAIGEVAYGFTEGFAAGAIAGITPRVLGVGMRPRGTLPLDARYRITATMPALYYPPGPNPESVPWLLVRPVLLLERGAASGFRISSGPGLIVAGPTETLLSTMTGEEPVKPLPTSYSAGEMHSGETFRTWTTWVVGASLPVSDRSTAFAESGVVIDGLELAGRDWIGGPPVVITVGLVHTL